MIFPLKLPFFSDFQFFSIYQGISYEYPYSPVFCGISEGRPPISAWKDLLEVDQTLGHLPGVRRGKRLRLGEKKGSNKLLGHKTCEMSSPNHQSDDVFSLLLLRSRLVVYLLI